LFDGRAALSQLKPAAVETADATHASLLPHLNQKSPVVDDKSLMSEALFNSSGFEKAAATHASHLRHEKKKES